jgi:hypothetical protein
MASSLPVRCTCWSSKETIRASRLTANLPVRIVGSGWSPERPTIAGIGTTRFARDSAKLQLGKEK